ncbi:MAG: hypothetical protein PUB20_00540 [Clostridia bacterium]|nr:hypothetical protein [Clostridia bacterium]
MKLKNKSKTIIAILCALILIIAVSVPVFIHISGKRKIDSYLSEDIKNVDAVRIIADCDETDDLKNTVAGFKETVRRGADGVTVDLCFNSDSIPVAAEDYSNADSAVPIEDFFKTMNEDGFKETVLYLNIVQLSKMTELNRLAVKYSLLNRLYIIGIDEAHYGLITSDDTIIPFYLNYSPSRSSDGSEAYELIRKYGASGVMISSDDASQETISNLEDYSVPFCVYTESQTEFCKAALYGAENIITSDAASAKDILDRWISSMQKRNASSVSEYLKSINEN